jgi:hypothetical protein
MQFFKYIVTKSIYYEKSESENKKTNKIVSSGNCLGESPNIRLEVLDSVMECDLGNIRAKAER